MLGKGHVTARVVDPMRRCLGIADEMDAGAIVPDVPEGAQSDRRLRLQEDPGLQYPVDQANPNRARIPMADVRSGHGSRQAMWVQTGRPAFPVPI